MSERAIRTGFRIDISQCADTRHAIAREHTDTIYTVRVGARRYGHGTAAAVTFERQLHRLPAGKRDLFLQIIVGADLLAVDPYDQVAFLHACIPRRTDRSILGLHIIQPHDQHALGTHLNADRMADRDKGGNLGRLRRNQHRKGQNQGNCDFFCIFLLHFFTSAFTMPRANPKNACEPLLFPPQFWLLEKTLVLGSFSLMQKRRFLRI